MVFNIVIDHLRQWCVSKADYNQNKFTNHGGIAYVGYQVAYELEFKLSTLIDKSFENAEVLKREIMNLIDIHYEPVIINPVNRIAEHIIDTMNREFCECLEQVLSESKSLTSVNIPY